MPDNPPITLTPILVDEKAAAEIPSVSKTTLWAMDKTGELGPPSVVLRRRRLHCVESLRKWATYGCEPRVIWLSRHKPDAKIDRGGS